MDDEELEFEKAIGGGVVDEEEAEFDALVGAAEPAVDRARQLVRHQPMGPPEPPRKPQHWSESLLRGGLDMVPFGEEIAGAASQVIPTHDDMPPELGGTGYTQNRPINVDQGIDDQRQQQKNAKTDNPAAFTTGQVASGVGQAFAIPASGAANLGTRAAVNTATGVGAMGAQMLGEGEGDLGERVGQVGQSIAENPVQSALLAALPGAATVVQAGARAAAKGLHDRGSINRVAATNPAAKMTALAENKGGREGLIRLGQDIEERGLHKAPWYKFGSPASAEDMHMNAARLRTEAGPRIGAAEDQITAAGVEIPVNNISDELRKGAAEAETAWSPTARSSAPFKEEFADNISNSLPKLQDPVEGPALANYPDGVAPVAPPVPEAGPIPHPESWMDAWNDTRAKPLGVANPTDAEYSAWKRSVQPVDPEPLAEVTPTPDQWAKNLNFNMEQRGAAPAQLKPLMPEGPLPAPAPKNPLPRPEPLPYQGPAQLAEEIPPYLGPANAPEDWTKYLTGIENAPKVPPAPATSGKVPFAEAVRQRRLADDEVNYMARGGSEGAGMKEAVNRQVGTKLRQNIGSGLDEAATTGKLEPEIREDYRAANKDFSVASTVEDSSLRAMMPEYGGIKTLKDLITGGQLKGRAKSSNAAAGLQHLAGGIANKVGDAASPQVARAVEGAAAPDPGTGDPDDWRKHLLGRETASRPPSTVADEKPKNEELKAKMQKAKNSSGNSWYDKLADTAKEFFGQ